MTMWRYVAVAGSVGAERRVGEIAGESAPEVRAALRRVGLQVIDLRPINSRSLARMSVPRIPGLLNALHKHLRGRRRLARAELFDSLSTMLASGIPLLEAFDALLASGKNRSRSFRGMLLDIRERLRGGESLAQAMRAHPSMFETTEIAIAEAGQHGGQLAQVLQSLADRNEHADELGHKLSGALAYPILVAIVGLGVTVFLSVKTLPDLTAILVQAKIPIPQLTKKVMWIGQTLAGHWLSIGLAILAVPIVIATARHLLSRFAGDQLAQIRIRVPHVRVLKAMSVGQVSSQLAELLRSGVPLVEALRVLAPTARSASLRAALITAADQLERGEDLQGALDERWFDLEFKRLIEIGQASGELDSMLARLGERYQRSAKRLIDRLAGLLEPCVILALAVLVGTVVMAAVLPLLRLQEVVR
jgi:type II secretory pathway component PulF